MVENRALAVRPPGALPQWNGRAKDFAEAKSIAFIVGASGIFPDAADQNAAFVKILVGASLGIGPAAALQHIKVFNGQLNVGTHLLAARIKASGRYDFEVVKCDDDECHVRFLKLVGTQWVSAGPDIQITLKQAHEKNWHLTNKGGELPAWKATPDDMLFAAVLRRAYKRYFPDLSADLPLSDGGEDGGESIAAPQAAAMLTAAQPAGGEIVDADYSISPDQPAESQPIVAPSSDPFDQASARFDHLNELCIAADIKPEQLRKQLLKSYGTDNFHKLTTENLDDLEKKLNAVIAKKGATNNSQPAAQPANA